MMLALYHGLRKGHAVQTAGLSKRNENDVIFEEIILFYVTEEEICITCLK